MFAIGTSEDCKGGLCCMWKNTIFRNLLYGEFFLAHDYTLLSSGWCWSHTAVLSSTLQLSVPQ